MNKTRFIMRLMTTFVVIITLALGAAGQVALKPKGQNAAPLRLKAMTAKVNIASLQFATTDFDLTFQNQVSERIEADFLFTVPEGAVVTDFAYFYGDERVVARIAEKERAAAIYQHITTRMRDPALVEMVGKNTFRARIFPVMPDADLRVQMRYVQALPAKNGVVTYSLPLRTEKSVRLDSVSVEVRVPDAVGNGVRVTNNIGLPMGASVEGGSPLLTLDGKNYRSDKDLRVSIHLPKNNANVSASPLWANLAAARSGGADGFFALALSANEKISAKSVQVENVRTYDVEQTPFSGGLLITGRYKDGGSAVVHVRDAGHGAPFPAQTVNFGRDRQTSNPAMKLWAAARIARLSQTASGRSAVVALSQRFTLPSKFTSWIAIPEEERKRYYREKNEADREVIARRLTALISDGRGNSAAAEKLRKQFNAVCKQLDEDPKQAMRDLIQQIHYQEKEEMTERLTKEILAGREDSLAAHRAESRLTALCRETNEKPSDYLETALYYPKEKAAANLTREIMAGRPQSATARRERRLLEQLSRKTTTTADAFLSRNLKGAIWRQVVQIATNIEQGPTDDQAIRESRRQLENAARAGKFDAETEIKNYIVAYRFPDITNRLVVGKHGESLYFDYFQTYNNYTPYGYPAESLSAWACEEWQQRLTRLAQYTGENPDSLLAKAEIPWAMRDFAYARNGVITARKSPSADPNAILDAETRFLTVARSDGQKTAAQKWHYYYQENTPDGREAFAKDRLARIAARTEGEALDAQLSSKPDPAQAAELQAKRAELKRREEELRARMGDPLLSVEAPPDAQSVVALMPNGEIKPLAWEVAAGKWQAHFDIPTYAAEGAYEVNVIVVLRDGTRQTRQFRYHVDVTAPQAKAHGDATAATGDCASR